MDRNPEDNLFSQQIRKPTFGFGSARNSGFGLTAFRSPMGWELPSCDQPTAQQVQEQPQEPQKDPQEKRVITIRSKTKIKYSEKKIQEIYLTNVSFLYYTLRYEKGARTVVTYSQLTEWIDHIKCKVKCTRKHQDTTVTRTFQFASKVSWNPELRKMFERFLRPDFTDYERKFEL